MQDDHEQTVFEEPNSHLIPESHDANTNSDIVYSNKLNGIAIASMVLGIIAIAYPQGFMGVFSATVAIILGLTVKVRIDKSHKCKSQIKANLGIGLGIASLVLFAIIVALDINIQAKIDELLDKNPYIFNSTERVPIESSSGNAEAFLGEPYVDNDYNFSISFPEGWIIKKPLFTETIAIKAIHRLEDGRFVSINIYVGEIEDTEITSMTAGELRELFYGDNAELLSSGKITINDNRAIWMKLKIDQEIIPIYAVWYMIVRDRTYFNIFGNTILGGYDWFLENEELLEASMKTFKFTN